MDAGDSILRGDEPNSDICSAIVRGSSHSYFFQHKSRLLTLQLQSGDIQYKKRNKLYPRHHKLPLYRSPIWKSTL